MSSKIKIYICGPISSLPNNNRRAFDLAERRILKKGFEAINPHKTCAGIKLEDYVDYESHWQACMRADIAQLMTADFICMLPGWENSRGAKIEVALAKELDITPYNIN